MLVWVEGIRRLPFDDALLAVADLIATQDRMPSLAELRRTSAAVQVRTRQQEEAWSRNEPTVRHVCGVCDGEGWEFFEREGYAPAVRQCAACASTGLGTKRVEDQVTSPEEGRANIAKLRQLLKDNPIGTGAP